VFFNVGKAYIDQNIMLAVMFTMFNFLISFNQPYFQPNFPNKTTSVAKDYPPHQPYYLIK
jgi:hypothetical protein